MLETNPIFASVQLRSANCEMNNSIKSVERTIEEFRSRKKGSNNDSTTLINEIDSQIKNLKQCSDLISNKVFPSIKSSGNTSYCVSRIQNERFLAPKRMQSAIVSPVLENITNTHKRSKSVVSKNDSSAHNPNYNVVTPQNTTHFSPLEAFQAYSESKNKKECLQKWIDEKFIPIKSTKFFEMYRSYRKDGIHRES